MKKYKHIYLIGFMGTGKSTVSKELKNLLGWKEVEMDEEIVRTCGISISEIFETYGEAYFREQETACIRRISETDSSIVSCGGGAVLREENVKLMKESGEIILLTARPDTVYHRVRRGTDRPLLKDRMSIQGISQLMEQRSAVYEKACDKMVSTDGKTPLEIAQEIAEKL